jgi:hypothetical protein
MRAFGWSGGDVGEGVKHGVGVGAQFLAVASEAGVEVGCEGVEGLFSGVFVIGLAGWLASQEIVPLNSDGSVIEFRVRLSGLEEITRWVLSWGSKAQVLGPVALKKRVKDELLVMVKATENV